jgi:hypothetical protein
MLKALKSLGHPLMQEEVNEAYQACTLPFPSAKRLGAGSLDKEWQRLDEKASTQGISTAEFVQIVCHFEPPCGVRLLQPRLTSSSWLQPRVAGVDAHHFALENVRHPHAAIFSLANCCLFSFSLILCVTQDQRPV